MNEKGTKRLRMTASSLDGRDFSNMDLENADFSFSSLKDINFDGANLRNAKLRFAALDRTTFRNSDLRNADLSFSSLTDVDLTGARVEGANFSFTSQEKSFNWRDLNLIGIIQNQGWIGTVVAVILGATVLYGINAISYFTAEIYFTNEPVRIKLYQYLVSQNVIAGVFTILLTQGITIWLDVFITRTILRHVILSVIVLIMNNLLAIAVYFLFGVTLVDNYRNLYPNEAAQNAPWYWYMWGPIIVANIFYFLSREGKQISRKISDQEFQLLNLEKLKTRAELDALQARINPHFLYNSLNSIASLVHEDPDKAEEMTLLLSKLFRYTTGRKTNDYFDTIENELEMVATYLQVEKVRFGERLRFTVEVTDPALKELHVPKFILQPIVENAIKHGVAKLAEQGAIVVRIYEEDEWLHLCVHDNGPPFSETMGAGYGMRSIQDKLKLLYGDAARLELHNEPRKSVNISIQKSAIIQNQHQGHDPIPAENDPHR
ncbi:MULTISPECIES: histidine kinase [Dyadobacter]|uniref:Histidine kinase n=1 Tax=Dyadobacter chenhuakuii TaxID=2909339 RepID=A0ABY4XFN0_9BACT|nr:MULTISPECIES: histidine kinase [Dyadobacter]MCF2495184.1 histidine kinase [Dyadobacter chenhuakuii]MCF2516233.1 histidine kinase [Dyadobacter sp. CY351]USJ29227.1 histidine kinase [Dyadobacter chenhuakuii]